MRKLFLLLLPILLVSCEARLENDVRALFKTRVVDVSGNPIANMEVSATTYRTNRFIIGQELSKFSPADEDFILGKGITNENGQVEFVMLIDGSFFINFNTENYAANKISVSRQELNDDYLLDIPETVLKAASNVQIEFVNTSGTTEEYTATFEYESLDCGLIYRNNTLTQDEDCIFYTMQSTRFNSTSDDGIINLNVFYPSIIEVQFTDAVGNESIRTFTITSALESYEITY
ncbi:hypothetical protein [Nonlabens sp.]|uniref:hypothetical protein n=1 Tax=Nonlabens sp. TaxID=1888209 RepID=UPI001BCE3E3B|nr:hypothetical protein [Nonlabens sp.]